MIGRLDELNQLERFYNSSKFEFLTMYGRRRIGKTTILREFAGRHKALFFSAQEKNDSLNLLDFSKMVQTFFEGSFISSFQNWEAAFEYITGKISDKKLVLIIFLFWQNRILQLRVFCSIRSTMSGKEKTFFLYYVDPVLVLC